ncbi:MAG: Crp/Fnr family transcriptional regulator [Chlorobi bacterium]|nr:Crp/Fnr family transcriptional regulator [Chlorobiota bacterium]
MNDNKITESVIAKKRTSKHCKYCMRQASFFKYLKEPELELVNNNRYELLFNPGETIFKQGAPSTHALSFTSGLAKVYVEGDSGRNTIVRFAKPVDFIAGPGLYVGNRHHFTITAIESSSVCVIDNSVFKSVMKSNFDFAEAYIQMLNKSYIKALIRISNQVHKQSKGKTAESLLYLSDEIYCSNPFGLTINLKELSEFCGLSKESLSKTIKEFVDDGIIIINRKKVEILKPDLLRQISLIG